MTTVNGTAFAAALAALYQDRGQDAVERSDWANAAENFRLQGDVETQLAKPGYPNAKRHADRAVRAIEAAARCASFALAAPVRINIAA